MIDDCNVDLTSNIKRLYEVRKRLRQKFKSNVYSPKKIKFALGKVFDTLMQYEYFKTHLNNLDDYAHIEVLERGAYKIIFLYEKRTLMNQSSVLMFVLENEDLILVGNKEFEMFKIYIQMFETTLNQNSNLLDTYNTTLFSYLGCFKLHWKLIKV